MGAAAKSIERNCILLNEERVPVKAQRISCGVRAVPADQTSVFVFQEDKMAFRCGESHADSESADAAILGIRMRGG